MKRVRSRGFVLRWLWFVWSLAASPPSSQHQHGVVAFAFVGIPRTRSRSEHWVGTEASREPFLLRPSAPARSLQSSRRRLVASSVTAARASSHQPKDADASRRTAPDGNDGDSGTGPRPRTKSRSKQMDSPIYFLERSMLKHDLLTKDREQVLAHSILRAAEVRQRLEPLIEERRQQKKLLRVQQHRASFGSMDDSEASDDDGTHGDDDSGMSELTAYGVGSYDEDEQFQARRQRSWLASKEDRLRTQEDGDLRPRDYGTTSYLADSLDLHLLTNVDVQSVGLSGGFEELEALLSDASLARQRLISSNIRLVVSIAKKWSKQTARDSSASNSLAAVYGGGWDRPSLDEVVQEGVLGLSRAVDRFDPGRNLRFSTYATFWITNSVRQCFQRASSGSMRLPLPYYDFKRRYKLLLKKYSNAGAVVPGLDVLAQELGTTAERLARILLLTQHPLSTDMPFMRSPTGGAGKAGGGGGDDSLTIAETLIDAGELTMEERVDLSFLRESLESAMASELAPHERDILRLRLGLDDGISRTVPEVVQEFDSRVTASEVRTIEQRAYKKLRSLRVLRAFMAHLDLAGVDRTTVTIR